MDRRGQKRVLIAGGGVAALEAALALRHLAEDRVRIELLAPEPRFWYRPLAVAAPFELGDVLHFELGALARRDRSRPHTRGPRRHRRVEACRAHVQEHATRVRHPPRGVRRSPHAGDPRCPHVSRPGGHRGHRERASRARERRRRLSCVRDPVGGRLLASGLRARAAHLRAPRPAGGSRRGDNGRDARGRAATGVRPTGERGDASALRTTAASCSEQVPTRPTSSTECCG